MKKNENKLDRIIRICIGVALLSLYFGPAQSAWGLVGLIPLFTGIFGFCPVYKTLGLSTNE